MRSLKENNAIDMEVKKAVNELKVLKKQLDDKELSLQPSETFNRSKFADLMIRRFFYDQSFSIYGGGLIIGILSYITLINKLNVYIKYFKIKLKRFVRHRSNT